MKIDLRYVICVGAFFVPTILIKFMWWLWGAEYEPTAAAAFSLLLGAATTIAGLIILFADRNSKPIYWTINTGQEE